jgi:hypothetical protein
MMGLLALQNSRTTARPQAWGVEPIFNDEKPGLPSARPHISVRMHPFEQAANSTVLLQRMPKAPTAENAVTIAAADFLDLENTGGLEVR